MADHFLDATKKADCISRETAIQAIEDIDENAGARGSGFTDPERIMRDSAFCALEAIQPADVRPVVRGKWEIDNSYAGPGLMNLRCSVCGEFGGTWRDCTLPSMLYKFCPNCGADMRPDKNDQRGEQQGRENRKTLR